MPKDSKARARAAVLAYTGIPPIQIAHITEAHFDEAARQVYVLGRLKGQGTKARIVKLLPDGVAAFKLMKRLDAWGEFSRSYFAIAITRACAAIGIPKIRPYDLRHSFGTAAYKAGGDIGAVQKLMGHTTTKMTQRYTLGADDARITATLDALAAQLAPQAGTTAGRSQAGKPSKRGRPARQRPAARQ
jgi:integrase